MKERTFTHQSLSYFASLRESAMNWSYVGGLFDGEGAVCIAIRRDSRRSRVGYLFVPLLTLAQVNLDFLQKVQAFIGAGCIVHGQGSKKRAHCLVINGSPSCLKVAQRLLPHLVLKHKRMEIFIDACKTIIGYQTLLKRKTSFGPMERPPEYMHRVLDMLEQIRDLNGKHPPTAIPVPSVRQAIRERWH
jgi:hypothetical protein